MAMPMGVSVAIATAMFVLGNKQYRYSTRVQWLNKIDVFKPSLVVDKIKMRVLVERDRPDRIVVNVCRNLPIVDEYRHQNLDGTLCIDDLIKLFSVSDISECNRGTT